MKKTIINILLFLSLALPTISQTEVQQENITLNTAVSGTHTYTASETVSLKPGFSYKATGNDVFQAKIDQTLLFPPSGNTYADAEGNIVSSPSQGAVVGSIPGAFDVSPTGAATYTVPIECLPGINGMQPNISLVYNSQSGNGIAGMCWSIGGLSMISRTGKNFYFDTDKSGIIWDNTSPFALDGQRLLEIQRWERGAITDSIEYRTESGLDKIMAYDIASWGPLYFIVYTKEGSVIQYGNTADIASYFPLKARYRRKLDISTELWNLGWAITQIRDKNGNYLNFNYSCDLEGTTITNNISYNNYSGSWISSIEYAHETQSISPRNTSPRPSGVVAEKIVFNYQPNISPITTYLDGLTMSNKYILDAIEIQDKTNVVHFTYNLSYEIRDNNYFLQEIKKTNAQGEFFHPIEFEWNDPSYTFSEVAKMAIEAPPSYLEYKNNQNYDMSEFHIQYGNINDDGIQDIVARYTYKKGDTEKFYMGIFLKSGNRYVYAYEKELINHEVFFLYDVDMDGIDDVIMGSASKLKIGTLDSYRYNITQHTYDTVNSELTLIENLAIIFVSSSVYDDRKKLQLIPGDFLGNGELQYLLMNGNKIISFINSFYFGITLDIGGDVYSQVFVTDINGNGKGEIMYFNGNQGNGNQRMTFYEYDTEDQTFKSIESISLGVKVIQIIPVDINGDGNTDIALKRDSNGKYLSFLSDGKNLISSDILSGFPDGSTAAFVDVNEDGKIDAIVNENIRDSNDAIISKSSIYINIGNEFVNKYSVNNSTLDVSTVSSPGKYGTTVGKGILTKKYYNTSNVDYFTVCSNIQFNKIKKIKNSLNDVFSIDYKLEKSHIAGKLNMSAEDNSSNLETNQSLPYDLFVVSKVSGKYLNNSYVYKYPQIHKAYRGFLGFLNVEVKDNIYYTHSISESKLNSTYNTLYPWKTTVKRTSGANISEQISSYSFKTFTQNKRFCLQLDSVSSQDFLKGITQTKHHSNYDAVMNPGTIRTIFGEGIEQVETYVYTAGSHWCANKIDSSQIEYKKEGESIIRSSSYTYDSKDNLLAKTSDPNTSFAVTTTYSDYDRYGNPATITVTANNQSRMSSKIHTASGRFVAGETDHLGETVTYIWDESKGLLTSKTSRLGTTTYLYDNWGRLKETIYPDGNRSVQTVQWAGDTGPSGAKYYSFSQASGEAPVYTWYDGLSREMRTESYGLNKNKIWVDTRYNTKGQVYRVSEPYFATDGIGAWAATYTYDVYGRQATVTTPMETTRFTYSGLSTTTTAPSRTKTTTTNPAGWTVSETTNGKTVTFTHYADGKVKTATPDGGMAVQLEYDLQGNRTRIIDPDAGTITSQYDAWGQLTREEQMVHKLPNAGPVITTYNYTSSGLLNWEQIGTERTTYEYDALHRLKKISILGKHEQEYSYDEYDRTIEIKDVVDGRTYTYGYGYDVLGRNNRVTYPSGYAIYNYYDRYGYLTSVKNQSGSSIWSALESNAKGQLKRTRKGNKETTYVYNSKNLLTDILTPETIQLNYAYNPDGTMLSRTDYRANQKEVFVYDNLKRLTGSTIRYANNPSGILASESVGYGNASSGYNDIYITSKSNFGVNMRYGEDGEPPHALTSFDASYRDAFPDQEITYTDFKKLQSIEQGSTLMNITYGVDRQRVKSQLTGPGTSLTRYYLGDYEEEVIDSNITRKIHYINGGDGLAAIHIEGSGYSSLYYTHTDFQGNLLMLTDANGNAIEEYAYDPWGNRRNPSNWTSSDIRTSFLIHRGYTMHEHLDHFGLINMNGRVYDPRAGMFLSPDPYIQAPGDWLNYNRYSYCMNNPLMYTDPDGEIFGIFLRGLSFIGGSLSNLIHGVNNPIKSAWNNSGNLVNGVSNSLQFPVFSNSNTLVTLGLDPLGLGLGGSVVHKSGSKITSSSRFGLSLLGGPYVNAGISYTNKDFNMSAGIGAGTNHWGWNASASGGKHGLGLGLGQTYYGNAIGPDGLSNSQTVGGYSILWDGGSFRIENDVFAFKNKNDRWRTNAWELTFGDFSVGSYIYTNDGNKASNGQLAGADENCESAIWGRNPHKDHGTWNNGRVYSSPLWVGYRVGNRISRIGFSHSSFQDLQQNGIHTTGFGKQNFYRMYDEFKSGLYLYSGHYNPFSLWGR